MCAKRRNIMWLSALMLPAQFALADNAGQTQSPTTGAGQSHSVTHLSSYKFALPPLEESPRSTSVQLQSAAGGAQVKSEESKKDAVTGLHWTSSESHPALGYRIDSNDEVRVHFGRHGAVMNLAVHF